MRCLTMERIIRRGDIYYAKLNPVVGSEQGGKHRYGTRKSQTPTHILAKGYECLEKDSIILLEQIRTLDKQRLQEHIGTFDRRFMLLVDDALAISIGITKKD